MVVFRNRAEGSRGLVGVKFSIDEASTVCVGSKDRAVHVELVDLLEREPFSLRDTEEGEQEAQGATRSPDEENVRTQACFARADIDQVGRGVADGEVQGPVGCSGHGHGFGSDGQWVNFTGHNPGDGSPSSRERANVNANQ